MTKQPEQCIPLHELKISTRKDGVMKDVPALNQGWCEERQFLFYNPPPIPRPDGTFPIGAKEAWLERISVLNSDLVWLLGLQQFRFWSQIVYYQNTMGLVLWFLEDAPPYYVLDSFPEDEEMWKAFQKTYYLVFLVLKRLATCKESETEFATPDHLGTLLYDYYIFTVPMMLDICQYYGRNNRAEVVKLINTVFDIQPKYRDDLKRSISANSKVFRFVEHKFGGRKLPEGELVKISERPDRHEDITLLDLKDLILHVLDTASNLSIFLDIYNPACKIFHEQLFEIKIVYFYENTVPEMYRKLELLANKDDTQDVYFDLRHKLDLMRVELLKIFRYCLTCNLNTILEKVDTMTENEVKKHVDDYLGVLTECLSEKVFMHDYHSKYPVDQDLDLMSQVCPEMDFMKCDFLLEAVLACFDLPKQKSMKLCLTKKHNLLKNGEASTSTDGAAAIPLVPKKRMTGVELDSLITEVKDILPHLGDGFVQKCLVHYDYASDSVINAILEDSLPAELRSLDTSLPRIPPDTSDVDEVSNKVERLNVFDNDEFDIMTQDHVDTSRIHRGKRKDKYKNIGQLLDDKSHRNEFRDMYSKFGVIDTEASMYDMYDDEYDDTYCDPNVSVGEEGDLERRPFVKPRVLQAKEEGSSGEESEEKDSPEPEEKAAPARDIFVSNPEEMRAKVDQWKQSRGQSWRRGGSERDVVGRQKGHGQEKQVVMNRDFKNTHKSSRGNHNRRMGAQRKRYQGMVPS